MPKKIVHVIIGLNVGGAELMLKRLVLHSQRGGQFQHEVISLTELGIIGADLQAHGIPVHVLGMNSAFSLVQTYFKLSQLLKKLAPDVVQTWMYHADFLGGFAAKRQGIKKIIWGIRTTDVTEGGSKLTVFLRKLCAKLSYSVPTKIVCAAHVSRDVHIQVGYDANKMVVIPNGFELDKLQVKEKDRAKFRNELAIKSDEILIGSVGRFNLVKNQRFFVEVAAQVAKHHKKVKFVIVGRDNTWDNSELVSWIDEFELRNQFILLGQRSDVPICMSAMDIFCLHSKTEGFPNVLGEAMAVGTLATTLDVGDSKYLLNNDKYIVENKEEMINVLDIFIANKSNFLETIVKNKKRIIEKFSLPNIIVLYEEIYSKD